ncbi:hypothetical protein Ea92_66A [Erwinia phage Ea9-2]|uniref:Uncharacterized protein n=1 Tax=Erwinia phage Ea9-2 TaxID=1429767 RepID=W6AR73_9CAUD|nr:hypothetical protein Ea92_66A [Erwinia phage Ea9-2]AHI60127.1 hypothetical protein Ea92_66A [Erwinia phage Ea9-2]
MDPLRVMVKYSNKYSTKRWELIAPRGMAKFACKPTRKQRSQFNKRIRRFNLMSPIRG